MTAGIVMLAVSVVLFSALMTVILPKMILKVRYSVGKIEDRGLKKYIYKGKNCIVYECGKGVSNHIKQYLLIDDGDKKILRCKTAHLINYLNYDIVVFDKYDKVRKIINVKEFLENGDFTKRVELPSYTSYVKLVIRQVDNRFLGKKRLADIPKGRILLYALCAILTTALEGFMIKVSCAYTFGGVFRENFIRTTDGLILGSLIAALIGIISIIIVACNVRVYSKR